MIDYLFLISRPNKQDRFDTIIRVLKFNNIMYEIQKLPYSNSLGNIIVKFNPADEGKRTVVSAHYDVSNDRGGTPGANDNGAACSILLNLILALNEQGTTKPIDIVFFDMEESGYLGSQQYLEDNFDRILGVYNLDVCGLGCNTVISMHNDAEHILKPCMKEKVIVLDMLPPGDAYTFLFNGVPTIYIINSTKHDLPWFKEYSKTHVRPAGIPDFLVTMHTRSDTPETCNKEQIEKIYNFVLSSINDQ